MIYIGMGKSWGIKHLGATSQAHILSGSMLLVPELVQLPEKSWDGFYCRTETWNPPWESEQGPPLQLQYNCLPGNQQQKQVLQAGGMWERHREPGLHTRQAPSRTASLWTVIFLRFKSMPSFPVWSCTKCSCPGDCQTERELKLGVFCVNKEWRKKCVLLFPMPHLAGFHVLRKTSMVMSVDSVYLQILPFFFFCLNTYNSKNTTAQFVGLFLNCMACSSHEPSKPGDQASVRRARKVQKRTARRAQ